MKVSADKNVYIVFTEYQLLQTLNICTGKFNSEQFLNIVYIIRQGKRMKSIDKGNDYNTNNIIFKFIDQEIPKNIVNLLIKEQPHHFFMFQDTTPLNIFLGHKMASIGAEVSLGPDGYGSYENLQKRYEFLSRVRTTLLNTKYLIKNKLFTGKIDFYNYTYASHHFIDNVWVTHPAEFVHRGKNKVRIEQLPELNSECLNLIKKLFNFSAVFPTNDSIYFFNQPVWNTLLDVEYNFLVNVIEQFPDNKVVLKLHPLTSQMMKDRYKDLLNLEILDGDFPAEILISSLQNCIVYSGWSTVLITENKSCNYYFNYPVFKKTGHPIMKQINIQPLKHISMVEAASEMKFPY